MVNKQPHSHVQTTFNFKKLLYNYKKITVAYRYQNSNYLHANLYRCMNLNDLIHQQLSVIFRVTAYFETFLYKAFKYFVEINRS